MMSSRSSSAVLNLKCSYERLVTVKRSLQAQANFNASSSQSPHDYEIAEIDQVMFALTKVICDLEKKSDQYYRLTKTQHGYLFNKVQ